MNENSERVFSLSTADKEENREKLMLLQLAEVEEIVKILETRNKIIGRLFRRKKRAPRSSIFALLRSMTLGLNLVSYQPRN